MLSKMRTLFGACCMHAERCHLHEGGLFCSTDMLHETMGLDMHLRGHSAHICTTTLMGRARHAGSAAR